MYKTTNWDNIEHNGAYVIKGERGERNINKKKQYLHILNQVMKESGDAVALPELIKAIWPNLPFKERQREYMYVRQTFRGIFKTDLFRIVSIDRRTYIVKK